ncbi:uncharacterized protein LOC123513858 [Portunus trituberculatus]|uniref:uncharacterized protein LOC123513858 n=1 Tax=Portunus trituberculatus TaxID=210409 RepID=UPI001E1CDC63|nr:uncharacterized protein LOC123513858 [Portunus trituberculatus]
MLSTGVSSSTTPSTPAPRTPGSYNTGGKWFWRGKSATGTRTVLSSAQPPVRIHGNAFGMFSQGSGGLNSIPGAPQQSNAAPVTGYGVTNIGPYYDGPGFGPPGPLLFRQVATPRLTEGRQPAQHRLTARMRNKAQLRKSVSRSGALKRQSVPSVATRTKKAWTWGR